MNQTGRVFGSGWGGAPRCARSKGFPAPCRPGLRLVWFWVALSVCATGPRAIDPAVLPSQYVIRNWTTADGLPQNTATCLLRSRDGFLWVGTGNGLARFDGVTFEVFSARTTPAIRQNDVKDLFEDSLGRLWVHFDDDLISRRDGVFTHHLYSGGVGVLFESPPGTVHLINRGGIQTLAPSGRFEEVNPELTYPGRFRDVCRHPDLGVLLLAADGFHRWVGDRLEPVTGPVPVGAEFAALDRAGRLYFPDGPDLWVRESGINRKLPLPW